MTDQQKAAAIVAALQQDVMNTNTGKVLRGLLIQNMPNIDPVRYDLIMMILGIPNEDPS